MSIRPRLLIAGVAGFAILLLAAEIGFRVTVGDRLLYRADPGYEYFPQPNQSLTRLGVRYDTNVLGMRTPDFSQDKPAGTLRVLVLGDSVVFGHTNISQPDLATSLLNGARVGDAKVETLNISAPSWGPGNMLAWLERHGTMNADMAIVVLSSDDVSDDRSFAPPNADDYPQHNPPSALLDWMARQFHNAPAATAAPSRDAQQSLPALFGRLAALPSGACVIIHAARSELGGNMDERAAGIAQLATLAGMTVIHDRGYLDASASYEDDIHLSPEGHKRLMNAMADCF